jgi:hypothetical protein
LLDALALLPCPTLCGFLAPSLSLGQVLCIAGYGWAVLLLIVFVDAPALSSHFVDDVGFRAAWITLVQVPLVFFLATKRGPLNLLAGVSYERVNWVHRWAGRGLVLSATVHMSIMMSSIPVSKIGTSTDKTMTVVRYGIGSYGAILWVAISSVLPLRRWSYRTFRINHCISTLIFAWVLFKHIPRYARLPVYMAVGFLACDWLCTVCSLCKNNISLHRQEGFAKFRHNRDRQSFSFGHAVKMSTVRTGRGSLDFVPDSNEHSLASTIMIRVCDVPLSWRPGQHVRLYFAQLGTQTLDTNIMLRIFADLVKAYSNCILSPLLRAPRCLVLLLYLREINGETSRTAG